MGWEDRPVTAMPSSAVHDGGKSGLSNANFNSGGKMNTIENGQISAGGSRFMTKKTWNNVSKLPHVRSQAASSFGGAQSA
eukprot:CAMPEP_0170496176 /NCGR_PEP_ID=MMETSP0208-20121228/20546_1 /TAXON_ID=197538 /ORGANISM="Strombidium inclinatum, Strain S3" /LENGTH=79 /DNA_ID=CAMNT_0010772645 /DNA_START=1552 /DNA_END=1791 /DNA_ORIENTATION=+